MDQKKIDWYLAVWTRETKNCRYEYEIDWWKDKILLNKTVWKLINGSWQITGGFRKKLKNYKSVIDWRSIMLARGYKKVNETVPLYYMKKI